MTLRSLRAFVNSIRGRLVVLVLLVILPAFALQILAAWRELHADIAARQLEGQETLSRAAREFDVLLTETVTTLDELARANDLSSTANCAQVFTALRFAFERLTPEVVNLGLADAKGNIFCAIITRQGERNLADRPEFRGAIQTGQMALGNYTANPLTNAPQASIIYPASNAASRPQTVIFVTLDVHWLEHWLTANALPAGSAVTLFAADGSVLWRTVDGERIGLRDAPADGAARLAALRSSGAATEGPDLDGVRRLHTVIPLAWNGQTAAYLHLGYAVTPLYAQAYRDLWWKLALLGLVLGVALVVAWQGNEFLFLHPLRDLMAAVQRLQTGDLSARVASVRGLGEVTELAQAFDRMADSLQQRELERQQLEQRFRAAFESSAIGMGLLSLDGWILAANAAVCQMSGFTEAELKQRNDNQNVYPPDAQVGMELYGEMLAGQRGYYSVERRYLRKTGEIFWARLTLSLVRDAAGQPAYLVGLIEDIDEQKRESAALAESEARFKAMYENATIGMAIIGLDRRVISVNQALEQMVGFTLDDLRHTDAGIRAHPDDAAIGVEQFRAMVSGEIPGMQMERRYIRKDGSVFWGRVTYSAVPDAAGKPSYLVGLMEDVTDEKQTAERLAEQEARHLRTLELRLAERTEELIVANERLREKAAQDAVTAERTRLARDLHDAVTQTLFSTTLIAEVLPDLWALNPVEGGRRLDELRQLTRGALAEMRTLLVELRPNALTEVPLPALLRQLTEALAGRSRIAIQLSVEGERKLPADVQVGLYRIAQEALNNVVKHARASQAFVTLRLGETVRLTVADNGAGFDPSAVTADHLGLKIMRERAEALGARFSVYSEPGEGTQISVVWSGERSAYSVFPSGVCRR